MDDDIDYRWEDVRVFLAVLRERTLAGAGARLGVDASTVSRRLGAFEEALGVRLFDRSRDGLTPTAAAPRLLLAAEEMEGAAQRLAGAADQLESAPEGLVRLTAPPGLTETFVVPLVPELARQYPRLRLEVDASITIADLTRREADLALRIVRPSAGDLVVTRLMTLHYRVLASPAYAAALGGLHDLGAARWIDWSRELGHVPMARWLAAHAPGVEPALRTNSIMAQIAAAQAGVGVAVLPHPFVQVAGLVEVPLGDALSAAAAALPRQDVWLVGHRAQRDVPRIAAVWHFLVEAAKALER
jgi:DNA-binding transcriptional LysR family regulator